MRLNGGNGKPHVRRGDIVEALRDCMIAKGYAETSLSDIARAANISASHLFYYYPGKEAVLQDLCDHILGHIFEIVNSSREETPEERIHLLVGNVFVAARPEFAIMVELSALSRHRPAIQKKLAKFNQDMREYLVDLFAQLPRPAGLSPEDASEIASGLWAGLFTNSYYEPNLDEGRARSLFRRTLFALGNVGNHGWQWGLNEARTGARKGSHRASSGRTDVRTSGT